MHVFKAVALTILLIPISLLPTSKPALTLQELRRQGVRPPARTAIQPSLATVRPNINAQPIVQLQAQAIAVTPVPLANRPPQPAQPETLSFLMDYSDDEEDSPNNEKLEQGTKLQETETEYVSAEDAKILYELVRSVSRTHQSLECKQLVQNRLLSKFFDAIDANDLKTISELASKNIVFVFFALDMRKRYLPLLRTDAAQKLLRFWHKTLSVAEKKSVPMKLWNEMRRAADNLERAACTINPKILIPAKILILGLTQDSCVRPNVSNDPNEIPLAEALGTFSHHLDRIARHPTALSLASMAGRVEIVECLLNAVRNRVNAIFNHADEEGDKLFSMLNQGEMPLWALLDCSTIFASSEECQKAATVLFKHLGLPDTIHHENYPIIAKKLIRAHLHIATMAERYWIQNTGNEALSLPARNPMTTSIQYLLKQAHGSAEIMQIIAEETADIQRDGYWFANWQIPVNTNGPTSFEAAALSSINGKKLGILLSVNAHPRSIPYQLAMGMLSHVEKNPRLLSNLQEYVRRCRAAHAHIQNEVNSYLLPVLAPYVAEYALPRMPIETEDYILNLRPTTQDENEQKD